VAERLDYPALVRSALLGMVRRVLEQVAAEGLPGEHHLYLGFRTDAPGVGIPAALRLSHPSEMTIVLQHQFWGLETSGDGFSVTLRFSGTPARVTVPWDALTAFADPSVPFGLRLTPEPGDAAEPKEAAPSSDAAPPASAAPAPAPVDTAPASAEPAPSANVIAFRRQKRPE